MGIGDKNPLKIRFHFHLPHHHSHHHEPGKETPRGCVAVTVGQEEEEEEQERFVVPVIYMNHPLFLELLKEAEEEYGFHQQGPINIPCDVHEFRRVRDMIDREINSNHHHHQQHDDRHHHHHHVSCFKA